MLWKNRENISGRSRRWVSRLNPIESLAKEEMDKGEDYISVMRENLEALKKTTDQPGKDIQPEQCRRRRQFQNYWRRCCKRPHIVWLRWRMAIGIPTCRWHFWPSLWLQRKLSGWQKKSTKAYYTTGYKTDIKNINITDTTMEFQKEGTTAKAEYKYVGYKILTYKKETVASASYLKPWTQWRCSEYVQFSDHNIAPVKAEHFHIFMGNESQENYSKNDNFRQHTTQQSMTGC